MEVDSLYTADITRTLPVSGTFSPTQRKVYEAVFERALMKDTFRRLVVPNLDPTGEYGSDFGRPAEIYRRSPRTRLTPKAWATLTG